MANDAELELFFDSGSLAGKTAQIVKLGSSDVTATLDFNVTYQRAVRLKHALNAFTMRNFSNGESRVQTAISLSDHNALKCL